MTTFKTSYCLYLSLSYNMSYGTRFSLRFAKLLPLFAKYAMFHFGSCHHHYHHYYYLVGESTTGLESSIWAS